MRRRLLTLVLAMAFCSGGFAQNCPNSLYLTLDRKVNRLQCVPCSDKGLCIVGEKKVKPDKQLSISHLDTLMNVQFDTVLTISQNYHQQGCFYGDGTLAVFLSEFQNPSQKSLKTGKGILLLYDLDKRQLQSRELSGLPRKPFLGKWVIQGRDLLFATIDRSGDQLWFLPDGTSQPTPFPFTAENPGKVLVAAADTLSRKAVICFATNGRTLYFETDFTGKSSFANMLDEPATHAQWVRVGPAHSLLMLYYHDDETFYMHPVSIRNHQVTPSDTVYCADILVPKTLPQGATARKTIIVTPHASVSFLPTQAQRCRDAVTFTTELYYAEYTNYFNGYYVEPRFNGYRYERADVHFFDTDGHFLTNVTFPYDEGMSLSSHIEQRLHTHELRNGNYLFYLRNGHDMTTMLLDANHRVKDPIRTITLPLPKIPFKKQKTVIDFFGPWYGSDQFLLTAQRVRISSQRKEGYEIRKLTYE